MAAQMKPRSVLTIARELADEIALNDTAGDYTTLSATLMEMAEDDSALLTELANYGAYEVARRVLGEARQQRHKGGVLRRPF